jgi:hypothetical protein
MNQTMSTSPNSCSGLFHLETIPKSDLDDMNQHHDQANYPGYNVVQPYTTGLRTNYFNIDFTQDMNDPLCAGQSSPCVHSTIFIHDRA